MNTKKLAFEIINTVLDRVEETNPDIEVPHRDGCESLLVGVPYHETEDEIREMIESHLKEVVVYTVIDVKAGCVENVKTFLSGEEADRYHSKLLDGTPEYEYNQENHLVIHHQTLHLSGIEGNELLRYKLDKMIAFIREYANRYDFDGPIDGICWACLSDDQLVSIIDSALSIMIAQSNISGILSSVGGDLPF